MKQTQKEAVYSAVMSVLSEHGVMVREGVTVAKLMNREYRAIVNAILFQGFKQGKIELDTQFANDSDLKTYISGLQSNWLRKDTRLNGGVKYKPANPGSRTGSGDDQLKALRQLLSVTTDVKARAEIQGFIDARTREISASKAPKVNISHLPPALHKYIVRA